MTGQGLLDRMELVNQELQLQTGEADVARGLLALNVAQDYFEDLLAQRGRGRGASTSQVSTSANTESSTFPAGLLRVDRLQLLDSNNKPKRELTKLHRVGGHATTTFWPESIVTTNSTGEPRAYWADGQSFFWTPTPDTSYTIRVYGFTRATDITAVGTFVYGDGVAFPLASFACRILKAGVDDNVTDLAQLAAETFKAVLTTHSLYNRDGATGWEYTKVHQE